MEFDDSININHLLEFGVGISLICNFLVLSDDKLSDDKQQESISECQAFNSKVVGKWLGETSVDLNLLAKMLTWGFPKIMVPPNHQV